MRFPVISVFLAFGFLSSCVDSEQKVEEPPVRKVDGRGAEGKIEPQPVAQEAVKKGEVTEVDLGRVFELRATNRAVMIDVRSGLFFQMGHIPGAVNLPKKSFDGVFPNLKPRLDAAVAGGRVLVTYCSSVDCPDAYAVAKMLAEKGYSASVYRGGWEEWKASGLD